MSVDYISAHKGGIQMYSDTDGLVGYGKSPEMVAYVLTTKGMASEIYGGSSMDFASENGFASDDGASLLLKKALELV
jgi:hypothetical protein